MAQKLLVVDDENMMTTLTEQYSVYEDLDEEEEIELFLPESSGFKSISEFLYQFYDSSALYIIENRTENELLIAYNEEAVKENAVTISEQSDMMKYVYRGKFKISLSIKAKKTMGKVELIAQHN